MNPEQIAFKAKLDQAQADVDRHIDNMVEEVTDQLSEGYDEYTVLEALKLYLENGTGLKPMMTRSQVALIAARTIIRLSRKVNGES